MLTQLIQTNHFAINGALLRVALAAAVLMAGDAREETEIHDA